MAAAAGLAALVSALPHASAGAAGKDAATASGAVITEWVDTVTATVNPHDEVAASEELLWHAFVSAAMYNAVVGIEGRYEPYRWRQRAPRTASPEAAAAAAAHRLLRASFPSAGPALKRRYAASLAKVPDGRAEDEGVAFGERAADHIMALRAGDGRGARVPFPAVPVPGRWRPTPPRHEPFTTAWLGLLRPLLLDSPDQFRPGPPPRTTSARYAEDFAELLAYGGRTGSRRTPAQTRTAVFFAKPDIQKALGDYARRHRLDIVDTARLFAAANTTQADAAITAWNAKLRYGTWRPVTAIREAGHDGNPATRPDPRWKPLLTTPAHPDYLSGHTTVGGALTRTLTELFGTSRIDLRVPSAGRSPTRYYRYAHEYNRDVVDSRVWGGIHTRFADTAGTAVGTRVSAWALHRYFGPVGG
ncbi:vanadium-dependent haloperoxidase [Streptomyces ficellus]|uniref:Vanadium-dependent haloperoxidase n=1 Tax=Streptomyces ficellus TaxID=1977088 RepID=A0ABT7Z2H1_9ACTN|nr:vanadium-dependent haloperoxidase [Streptomyces ficellus]MDN3293306.1 vanadium-dependent haloperoxidase [Streptomyces ficellus]